jgi:hypothetical protein
MKCIKPGMDCFLCFMVIRTPDFKKGKVIGEEKSGWMFWACEVLIIFYSAKPGIVNW